MKFAELTQIGLLGTERQALTPTGGETALGQLQGQLDPLQRERTLLSLAALSGLHERTGALPVNDKLPGPTPCPPETQERINDRAGNLLQRLLNGEFAPLLPEGLGLAAKSGRISLPEALPQLLSLGVTKAELREGILPLLGERGRWLAAYDPEWAWVSGAATPDEALWETGEPAARLVFLGRLRQSEPQRARELLAGTWKTESPDDRLAFIAALQANLSLEDEPFLEAALDDKRKEVRRQAAMLLSRLPDSALVQRMRARVQPLLRFIPATAGSVLKLKKATPAAMEITLPAECDKTMQRDGIEPKPALALGEKAWWLVQMLEAIPLDFWTTEWKTSPGEIIAASGTGEWKKELEEAWLRAGSRQGNVNWAGPLFELALTNKRADKLEGLLMTLPAADRENRLMPMLAGGVAEMPNQLLALCRHEWSADFSRMVLAWMRRLTAQASTDWPLRAQFKEFAPRLAPATLTEAATGWPTGMDTWEFWSKGVDEFLAITQFRLDLHNAFTI